MTIKFCWRQIFEIIIGFAVLTFIAYKQTDKQSMNKDINQILFKVIRNVWLLKIIIATFYKFKETVRVISSVPPCQDGNVQFTTVPLKP